MYLAERVVLAVTPLDVCALELVFGRFVLRLLGSWRRDDLHVKAVEPQGQPIDIRCPALLLATDEWGLAELLAVRPDDETARVIDLLL